ncbi:MAG: NADH-quinone oxidoreductase subunit M [Thermoplasmata archaeon]
MIVLGIFLWVLFSALIAMFLKERSSIFTKISSVITLIAIILYSVLRFSSGYTGGFVSQLNIALSQSVGIYFSTGVSGFADSLLILTGIIFAAAAFVTDKKLYPASMFMMIMLTEAGMIGLLISRNFLFFYVFWELVLVPVYFIIGKFGGSRKDSVSLKFFVYTHIASIFMLLSIFALYSYYDLQYGVLTFQMNDLLQAMQNATFTSALPEVAKYFILFGFVFAFLVKLPSFPVHAWLADSYEQAPYPGTIILAGALSAMGGYGLFGIIFPFGGLIGTAGLDILAGLGLISISYFALTAMFQQSLKRMMAYASAASMGFVTLAFASSFLDPFRSENALIVASGGMFQIATHGIIMLLVFASIYFILIKTGSDRIPSLGGIYRDAPFLSTLLLGGLLASLGLPGLAGFVGEFSIIVGSFQTIGYWIFLLVFGMLITASYHIWAAQKALYGPYNEKLGKISDVSGGALAMLLLIFTIILILGIFPVLFFGPIQAYAGGII